VQLFEAWPKNTGIEEADVPDEFSWNDTEGNVLRMMDNFLITNLAGNPVSLEAFNNTEVFLVFGNLIRPQTLKEDEPLVLWDRSQLSSLERSERLNGVRCTDYGIDVTYGDESFWVISETGVWYKLRGEQGPGSALEPSPLYRGAFEESRRKYEACMLSSRLLLQSGDEKKRITLENLIHQVTELSGLGDWPVDAAFLLSRGDFIAEQVKDLELFDGSRIGEWFGSALKKDRVKLIRKLLQSKRQPVVFHTPSTPVKSESLRFPMDDSELLALDKTDKKIPQAVFKVHCNFRDDPLEAVYPSPPKPSRLLNEPWYGVCDDTLGSLLSSYQALHLMSDYLRLDPMGLQELLMALVYRPAEDDQGRGRVAMSPLLVEIIMRLLDFILAQPENEEIRKEILGEEWSFLPLLSGLTWPYVVSRLITAKEELSPLVDSFTDLCKDLLLTVMEEPVAFPFLNKVDPVALSIPTYDEIVDKPMDYGTVCDRLFSGFYSRQDEELLGTNDELIRRLSSDEWTERDYMEGLYYLDKQPRLKPLIQQRQIEIEHRKKIRNKKYTATNDILAQQGMVPCSVVFLSSPLGIKIGDSSTNTRAVDCLGPFDEPYVDMFRVTVTGIEAAAPFKGDVSCMIGDRVIKVGDTLVADMETNQVANVFRAATFPLGVLFGRPHSNPFYFETKALEVLVNEEEEVEEEEDGGGGGVDALYADVQLISHNCIKFNTRRAEISGYAQMSRDHFETLFQNKVVKAMDAMENAELSRRHGRRNAEAEEAVRSLRNDSVNRIPPQVRTWILGWLVESMLQTEAVKTLIETGIPSPELEAWRRTSPILVEHGITAGPLIRQEPLGRDRFMNRYWWFDGDALGRIFVEMETKQWGVLSTKKQVDALVRSLNPLGENELKLLKSLAVLYVRVANRMNDSSHSMNEELMAKVSYGVEVAAYGKAFQKKTFDEVLLGPTPIGHLSMYKQPHHVYSNSRGGPYENSSKTIKVSGDTMILLQFMHDLETLIWSSRVPFAMGKDWSWPHRRLEWHNDIDTLEAEEANRTLEMGDWSKTYNARKNDIADLLLELERQGVAFYHASPWVIPMRWWLVREDWVRDVKRAQCESELGVLARRMGMQAVRWDTTDKSVNILYSQHEQRGVAVNSTQQSEEMIVWGVFGKERDVSFGQVVTQDEWIKSFGYVGFGCFLGSYLHHALFQKSRNVCEMEGLSPQHIAHATTISGLAMRVAQDATTNGGLGFASASRGYSRHENDGKRLSDNDESLEVLKKALLKVMRYINVRQKDVADQIGCSQSHLSLWLNDRDGVNKRNFEPKVINWLRAKNMEYQWVKSEDITDGNGNPIEINGLIEPIPPLPYGRTESIASDMPREEVVDAVLPLIKAVCADITGGNEVNYSTPKEEAVSLEVAVIEPKSFFDVTFDNPQHPYATLFKSGSIAWQDVIPYKITVASPRNFQVPETDCRSWMNMFSPLVRQELENCGMDKIQVGSKVLYFAEGHAFANAQGELRMATEMIRAFRESSFGQAIESVIETREPIVCQVIRVSHHLAFSTCRRFAPVAYCEMELEPVSGTSSCPMLDIGIDYSHDRLTIRDVLVRVVLNLLGTEEASLCTRSVTDNAYKDLYDVVPRKMDLETIYSKVLNNEYLSVDLFLVDLNTMCTNITKYFVKVHQYNHVMAQAAATLLFKAKVLLRHPDTLCALKEVQKQLVASLSNNTIKVVLRPHFEHSFPSYVVEYETYQSSLAVNYLIDLARPRTSKMTSEWKLGMKVTPRNTTKKRLGVIVGFRHPTGALGLPWASIVVNWSTDEDSDATLNLPKFAQSHANPWEIIQVSGIK